MNGALKLVSVFISGLLCLAELSACATPTASVGGLDSGSSTPSATDSEADNPLFHLWPSHVGTLVQFDRTTRISGGVPGMEEPALKSMVTYKLSRLTPADLTIEVSEDNRVDNFVIPVRMDPESPSFPKFVKAEDVILGEKTYSCKVYRYQTTSSAEVGRDTQGLPAEVTVWVSPDMPGGVVRRQISLTIKASYNIEDTLVPSPAATDTGKP
jgi:hypothetical protein